MSLNREMANAYANLLNALYPYLDQKSFFAGIKEGLNKFLSNYSIKAQIGDKYRQGHFYSELAVNKLMSKERGGLIYEHMVPKEEYINSVCIKGLLEKKRITPDFIENLLEKYWKIAIITQDEDTKLPKMKMPQNWDGVDIFARYKEAGINLIPREETGLFS